MIFILIKQWKKFYWYDIPKFEKYVIMVTKYKNWGATFMARVYNFAAGPAVLPEVVL